MQAQHCAIKIGDSCLAVPLLGEEVRRRAGDGRHGEPLRELAQALVRAGGASAIVLGAGIGEWAADLVAGGVNSIFCVEDDADSYARLKGNVSRLGGQAHQALVSQTPVGGGTSLTFNELLNHFPSFANARLLAVSARFGPGAIESALDFITARRPVLILEVRLDPAHGAEVWESAFEQLANLGFDSGLAFDPLGHPLGAVTRARFSELMDRLESTRAHGSGLASFTLLLSSAERQDLLGEVRARTTKRTRAADAHRIAVVRLDKLGDQVLGAGIFPALRASFPHSRIVAVIPAVLADLYARCPSVDAILTLPTFATYDNHPSNWTKLIEYLRSCSRFDLVLNPRFSEDYCLAGPIGAALAAPGARIVGFKQVRSRWKHYNPNNHFNQLLEAPDTLHVSQYARVMVEAVTGRAASAAPEVWWKSEDWEKVASHFGLIAEGFIAVGVGAADPFKQPSLEIYQRILRRLLATAYPVVLVGSAAERRNADLLREQFPGSRIVNSAGTVRLPELSALLAHARLYVGPDSGPKHIAAAVRTPVVEISWVAEDYPATSRNPGRCWSAWDTQARTVYPDKAAFLRAILDPDFLRRPLTSFNTQQFESALADLLGLNRGVNSGIN